MKIRYLILQCFFISALLGCSRPENFLYVQSVSNAPAPGQATQSFYACGSGNLYTLLVSQGTILNVTSTTYEGNSLFLDDMAIDGSGTIYGKEEDTNGIYKINADTGVATQIIPSIPNQNGELAGLTVLPNGNLATYDNGGNVLTINLSTLQIGTLVSTPYYMNGGDLKLLPDGYIYWTVSNSSSSTCQTYSGDGNQTLVRIDPNSGTTIELGCLDQPDIYGLGFANGAIYGFTGEGNVLQVNIQNAATTVVSSTGNYFEGAASNPALW